jgi:hypothetical protein
MTRADVRSTAAKISSLKTIEGLLDYAILESAELGLPLIVCLLLWLDLNWKRPSFHRYQIAMHLR